MAAAAAAARSQRTVDKTRINSFCFSFFFLFVRYFISLDFWQHFFGCPPILGKVKIVCRAPMNSLPQNIHTHAKMPKLKAMRSTVRLRLDQLFNDFSVRTSKWFTCCGPMMRAWEWDGYANTSRLCTCVAIHAYIICIMLAWLCACVCVLAVACCFILETSLGFFIVVAVVVAVAAVAAVVAASSWRTQLFHKNSLTFNFSKQQLHESEKCTKKIFIFIIVQTHLHAHMKKPTTKTISRAGERQKEAGLTQREWESKRVRERGSVREHWALSEFCSRERAGRLERLNVCVGGGPRV